MPYQLEFQFDYGVPNQRWLVRTGAGVLGPLPPGTLRLVGIRKRDVDEDGSPTSPWEDVPTQEAPKP